MSSGKWSLGNFASFFARPDYLGALIFTHEIAFAVTVISVMIAFPTAHLMVRYPACRSWLIPLLLTPLLSSIVVRTFGWMVLLGPTGLVNSALVKLGFIAEPLPILFRVSGVLIGLVHVFFPLAVFPIYNALLKINWDVWEASESLGVGPVRTFVRVILPLASAGIINGAAIVYLLSTGAVVTPLLLGGPSNQMLGTLVYSSIFTFFNVPRAAVAAIVLTISSFSVVGAMRLLGGSLNRNMDPARR